jgi:hypothetical protein
MTENERLDKLEQLIEEEAELWDTIVHVDLVDDFMGEHLAKEHAEWLREQIHDRE